MAGIWYQPGDRYERKKKRQDNAPFRNVPRPGYNRRACWGRAGDPDPGTFSRRNCKGNYWNFRYSDS